MSDPAATLSTGVGTPQPDPTNDMRAPAPGMCHGCGGYHGSVNAGMKCLENVLAAARALLSYKDRKIRALVEAANGPSPLAGPAAGPTPDPKLLPAARPPDVIGAPPRPEAR